MGDVEVLRESVARVEESCQNPKLTELHKQRQALDQKKVEKSQPHLFGCNGLPTTTTRTWVNYPNSGHTYCSLACWCCLCTNNEEYTQPKVAGNNPKVVYVEYQFWECTSARWWFLLERQRSKNDFGKVSTIHSIATRESCHNTKAC